MSKHDSAPTHGWVIGSQINKWLALIFVVLILISIFVLGAIRYSIERDCTNPYTRDLKIGHSWIHLAAGSTKPSCPQHEL